MNSSPEPRARKAQWPPWRVSTKAMWGLARDARAGFRKEADEGIVLGAEDERGNGDAVDDAGAGGAVVVVVGRRGSRNSGRRFSGRTRGWSEWGRCRGLDRWRERARLCGEGGA